MDPVLQQIYRTNLPAEESSQDEAVQKLAAALDEEGINFDELPADEQEAMLEAVQGEGSEAAEGAEEGSEAAEGSEKLSEALFQEADQMGRIMAHSAHQEATLIEQDEQQKVAAGKAKRAVRKATRAMKRGGSAAMRYGKKGGKAVARAAKKHPFLAAGAAGAGGLGAGYGLGKKSADQKFEEAVEDRVLEVLDDLGIDPESLQAE